MTIEEEKCAICGQVANGQSGEVPCVACGLPTVHDASHPGPDWVLAGEFDARVWAKAYVDKNGGDEDVMLGWFSSAIMAGHDFVERENANKIAVNLDALKQLRSGSVIRLPNGTEWELVRISQGCFMLADPEGDGHEIEPLRPLLEAAVAGGAVVEHPTEGK